MNEQLQNALAELLGKTIDGIDSSVAFMQAELPDVITQLLTWYAAKSAFEFVSGIILLIATFYVCFAACRKAKRDKRDGAEWTKFEGSSYMSSLLYDSHVFFVATVFLVLFVLGCSLINLKWLQIWIAPKIWLIEYSASFIQ